MTGRPASAGASCRASRSSAATFDDTDGSMTCRGGHAQVTQSMPQAWKTRA